jgi:hypothetical protein
MLFWMLVFSTAIYVRCCSRCLYECVLPCVAKRIIYVKLSIVLWYSCMTLCITEIWVNWWIVSSFYTSFLWISLHGNQGRFSSSALYFLYSTSLVHRVDRVLDLLALLHICTSTNIMLLGVGSLCSSFGFDPLSKVIFVTTYLRVHRPSSWWVV